MLYCEAGTCGYALYGQLSDTGRHCPVVAPSRVAKTPEERVKTDGKNAQKPARMFRGGNLASVWVPDEEQEAVLVEHVNTKAQKRLCGRYYKLTLGGKTTRQTTVAVAREIVGLVWDVVRTEMEKLTPKAA